MSSNLASANDIPHLLMRECLFQQYCAELLLFLMMDVVIVAVGALQYACSSVNFRQS